MSQSPANGLVEEAQWAEMDEGARDRFHTAATVRLCVLFSEDARLKALQAESRLMKAQKEAEQARAYLERTSNTLEEAIRLHAMGRM